MTVSGVLDDGVTVSPDRKGYCCAADPPSCGCSRMGAFVLSPEKCDEPGGNPTICDLHPFDWISRKDGHGCNVYDARNPPTVSCFQQFDMAAVH